MAARAIWQATLKIKKHELPVKLYAAVEDRQIHFHLLHKRDRTRVEQQMVDTQTGQPVPSGEALKAFEAEPGLYVKLTPEEIERSAPEPGRAVSINRFIPLSAIDPFLFDRPYYLGPDPDSIADYFALAQALEKKAKAGIAHWVMRKHSYRGALTAYKGYLVLITLRRAAEVIPIEQLDPPGGPALSTKEKDLAGRLLEELSGTFRASDYHDEYQERVRELIDAKRSGKRIRRKRPARRPRSKSLADSLEKSCRRTAGPRAVNSWESHSVAATKSRRRSKPRPAQKKPAGPFHAFWSGSLGFGLVNVRVRVFPASRYAGIRLHMISPDGSLLKRKYYCSREGKELSASDIVRAYELENGSYITVDDKELEALEPEKTQEIALQKFVPRSDLPPVLFERGYYLTPQKDAGKAYRLLALVMEHQKRAGIASFVMHDREYVVAIFARAGILCAQTLRFHDELREPSAIGLPKSVSPPEGRVTAFEQTIDALSVRVIPRAELADDDDRKLRSLIQKKVKSGKDLIEIDSKKSAPDREDEGDLDLLETIRKSLR